MKAKGWIITGLVGILMMFKMIPDLNTGNRTFVFAAETESDGKSVWHTETMTVNVPASLSARTFGGSIAVDAHDRNEITVDIFVKKDGRYLTDDLKAPVEIKISDADNRVEVSSKITDNRRWFRFLRGHDVSVSYLIKVPESTEVRAKTTGGKVSAAGIAHNVSLITSGGTVTAKQIAGDVLARTSGGPITLHDISGDLTARTSGGRIRITDTSGRLNVFTSGGSIALDNVSGSVEARTSGGSITAEIPNLQKYMTLSTTGGSIEVLLPYDQGLDIRASGTTIQNNLADFEGKTERRKVDGHVKGGGIPVDIRAVAGSVQLDYPPGKEVISNIQEKSNSPCAGIRLKCCAVSDGPASGSLCFRQAI